MVLSLARRAALRSAVPLQFRYASTTNSHHGEHQDSTQYPQEDFANPIWRNTLLFTLFAAAAYKYAPEPSEEVYLTRWIAMYTTPQALWLDLNARHTAQEADVSDMNILLNSAQKPKIHRYRYPQIMEQQSPFLNAVGMGVDTAKVVVKGDQD